MEKTDIMKKSEIYKCALVSVITDLAAEIRNGMTGAERVYAIVNELCQRINMELQIEPVRERNLAANASAAKAREHGHE